MWAALVVITDPAREHRAGVIKVAEQRLVQQLIAHAAVEGLADPVLHRLARAVKCQLTFASSAQVSMALDVNSVP